MDRLQILLPPLPSEAGLKEADRNSWDPGLADRLLVLLLGGVTAVHEDCLARHPPAIGDKKTDIRNDVLNVGKSGL